MRTRRVEPWTGLDNSTGNSTATRQEDSSGSTEPRQLVRQQCSTARTQQTRGERGRNARPPRLHLRLSLHRLALPALRRASATATRAGAGHRAGRRSPVPRKARCRRPAGRRDRLRARTRGRTRARHPPNRTHVLHLFLHMPRHASHRTHSRSLVDTTTRPLTRCCTSGR